MSHIIDMSDAQGIPDFHALKKAGVVACYIKATEGETFVSGHFHEQWAKAGEAKLVRGTYHFARQDLHPGTAGARAEAAHYVHTMRALPARHGKAWHVGELRPVLDFEKGTPDHHYSPWRDEFFREVRALSGHSSVLYTFPGFNSWKSPPHWARQLWIAHFNVKTPTIPGGYHTYALHQFSDNTHLAGKVFDDSRLHPHQKLDSLRCTQNG